MKKLTLLLIILLAASLTFAQNTVSLDPSGDRAYEEGDKIFQVGIGFGRAAGGYGFGSYGFGLPVLASLEFGLHEYFSVGPYAAFARYNFNYAGARTGLHATYFSVGARGSFHYVPLINDALDLDIDESKIDLYVTALLGLETYSVDYDDIPGASGSTSGLDFGTVIGGRYMFGDNLGVYSELGYGALSVFTIGLSYIF